MAGSSLVKLGIASTGDRLNTHRRAGLSLYHLWTGLPSGQAREAEKKILSWLAEDGHHAVRGKEYFEVSLLPLIVEYATGLLDEGASLDRL